MPVQRTPSPRGSHLYVPCRSVCDQDQIESSDQSPFWEPIKGSRLPPNCDNQMIKNHESNSTIKIKQSRAFEGMIKWSSTLFADQRSWSRSQTLQQATYKWLPLVHWHDPITCFPIKKPQKVTLALPTLPSLAQHYIHSCYHTQCVLPSFITHVPGRWKTAKRRSFCTRF